MKSASQAFRALAVFIIVASVMYFLYYALYVYKPTGYVACQKSALARQIDVAVNVTRQWFGREANVYKPCPGTNQ